MKVDQKKVMANMQSTGLNFAGATVGYIAVRKAPEKFQKFAGPGVLVLGLAAQLSSNKTIQEIGSGIAVIGAIETANKFLPDGLKQKTTGILPALSGTPYALGEGFDDDYDEEFEGFDEGGVGYLGMEDEEFATSLLGLDGELGEAEEMEIAKAIL
ncbi:hypothetical protein [Flexithrix dorotheae]|uniref:hypothetical protein n=1 Tax=Flexithrix dorotheae TaxID=70993 RepID=UPI0003790959|nr:hypothetical protein [Flexithrix dorotheae]